MKCVKRIDIVSATQTHRTSDNFVTIRGPFPRGKIFLIYLQ